jgi:hypothetical protein
MPRLLDGECSYTEKLNITSLNDLQATTEIFHVKALPSSELQSLFQSTTIFHSSQAETIVNNNERVTNLKSVVLVSGSHTHGDTSPAMVLLLIGFGVLEQS